MAKSVFDTKNQQKDLKSKIVVGLERISEVFKALLWEHAKSIGLSPIQIQILIFIAHHKQELSNVSHLAKEFNVTKPTISDAVKVLLKKELVTKEYSNTDNRSYSILLSEKGKLAVQETANFANPIKNQLDDISDEQLEILYASLTQMIYHLNKMQLLSVQRTCYMCKFYEKKGQQHHCNFLNKRLQNTEIRLDCPEFELE